jgi:type VI secretion system protein ImpA
MLTIDAAALLQPVSTDAPCGDNLEYDPAFGELERAAQGNPERVMGDVVIPAEDPDWSDVFERALELLGRTKDLRVAVHLLHAGVRVGGLSAVPAGLAVVHGLVSGYWDTVHPELDKEDDDDPTLRVNSLLPLNDRAGLIAALARCPLVRSRALGTVSLRDMRIAAGELAPGEPSGSLLDTTQIGAAFLDGNLEELQANADAVRAALGELQGLTAFLSAQVGALAPDLGALNAELKSIQRALSEQLGRRGVGAGTEAEAEEGVADAPAAARAAGEIRNREDVVRILDRICEYFERNEPSSPVPLLLRRAKGLIAKDFLEILNDLTPDAMSQARSIAGLDKNE